MGINRALYNHFLDPLSARSLAARWAEEVGRAVDLAAFLAGYLGTLRCLWQTWAHGLARSRACRVWDDDAYYRGYDAYNE